MRGLTFACLSFQIHYPGPEGHVFKRKSCLLLLQVSSNVGRKTLMDEDGSAISYVL